MNQRLSPAAQKYADQQAAAGGGVDLLRDQLTGAPEATPSEEARAKGQDSTARNPAPSDMQSDISGGGDRPPREGRPHGEIFEGCPVTPLGVYGEMSFYLDVQGQLRGVETHSRDKIRSVFGNRVPILRQNFPARDKEGNPKRSGFDGENAAEAMTTACHERGVWKPTGKIRGPGAWTDEDGRLVLHLGDEILIDDTLRPPGLYQGKVYAATDPVPRPADRFRTSGPGPGAELLALIETWRWRRPDVDPQIVLGLICGQMLGGALDWRPIGWLTGDAATGKSTFQKLMLYIHGGSEGLLQAADATEAGIRSVVGYSSLPVAIDELEPDDEGSKKGKDIVKLARLACSGAQIFRGSSDQKGYQSNAYSSFMFSSINIPPIPPQDRSRLVQLDLDRIPDGAPKVDLNPRKLREIGARLRRLLLDGWDTLHDRQVAYAAALARTGHTMRGTDNFGTLLAMADIALGYDMPDEAALAGWAAKLSRAVTDESVEIGSNAEEMMDHLLSQDFDVWRSGERFTVAQWIMRAADMPSAPAALRDKINYAKGANEHLSKLGLRVRGTGQDAALFVANKPIAGLKALFEGSVWAGGVWSQATARLPGAEPAGPLTLAGIGSRGRYIPFTSIPGLMAFPADRSTSSGAPEAGANASYAPTPEDFQ